MTAVNLTQKIHVECSEHICAGEPPLEVDCGHAARVRAAVTPACRHVVRTHTNTSRLSLRQIIAQQTAWVFFLLSSAPLYSAGRTWNSSLAPSSWPQTSAGRMSSWWHSGNIWTTRTWTFSWLHTGTLYCRYSAQLSCTVRTVLPRSLTCYLTGLAHSLCGLRLLWSVQMSAIHAVFGSWAGSGARGFVRSSTDRVSKV